MLALYGLKWNPFTPNVPTEALHVTTRLESFCWRVQQLAGDGGFALVTGVPGCGKSAALRGDLPRCQVTSINPASSRARNARHFASGSTPISANRRKGSVTACASSQLRWQHSAT